MNGEKKKELSPELRILLASILSMAVIIGWTKFFGFKTPPPNATPTSAPITAPAPSAAVGATAPTAASVTPSAPSKSSTQPLAPVRTDTQERTIVVENDFYRVEISNRGAVVKSWQLKRYKDDAKPQRTLDLVHPDAAAQTGGWPFSIVLDDAALESAANSALYQTPSATSLQAPADAEFIWSNGQLEVTKRFHFDHTYVVRVETSAKLNGAQISAGLAWRGGFGDVTVRDPAPVEQVNTLYSQGGKLQTLPHKKLNGPEQWGRGGWQSGADFAGIEDRYFTAVFLPAGGSAPGTMATRYLKLARTVQVADKQEQEPVAETAVTTAAQPLDVRVYLGPKDYDVLKKMTPPLHALVQFGWFEIIADPMFHLLKWLHSYIPDWGWAIIVLTIVINMLFFPLRISGYRTAQKMQRIQPEVKVIQERYKKYSMRDQQKQGEKNQAIMALYKREGINPASGCLQMLLQMPIWIGLNSALRGTIELRHASWMWLRDLSAKDPYYILPVLMGVSMYLVSKMTPMATTDPQQQMMMKIMPVMMSVIFVISPFSSGLALYIATSSVVGIGQQWFLNRTHPATAPTPAKLPRGKK